MSKIGVLTIFEVPNFGSVLQAFATQVTLGKLGYECVFIDYTRNNEWYFNHGVHRPDIKNKVAQLLGLKACHRKEKKLDIFRKTFLHRTRTYRSLDELQAADWSTFDVLAIGSDQVWNTRYSYGDKAYLLPFASGKKKISLASSFALKELPTEFASGFKQALQGFFAISVREQNGADIIRNQLGIKTPVKVILDPTLWLSREDWLKSVPRSKWRKMEKYILLYMWDYAFKPQPFIYQVAKYFQEKYGYIIYVLEGKPNELDEFGLKYKSVIDSSIQGFIDYFSNADIVITSSFHGTAFAVNFGKPLVSIVPTNGDDRQSSLLYTLGLSQLTANSNKVVKNINPFYDVEREQQKLQIYREKTTEWIKSIL